MSLDAVYRGAEEKMVKTGEYLLHEFSRVRTGRATPALLDVVKVDYYGTKTPLNQVATITVPEPRMLIVQPWEKKLIGEIERAILQADLGLNPSNDGSIVRVPIPVLSEERRKDLVKLVKKYTEEARIAVRNIRRDSNEQVKKLEKSHEVSEDQSHTYLDKIQKLTDKYIKEIDDHYDVKEKEIMED